VAAVSEVRPTVIVRPYEQRQRHELPLDGSDLGPRPWCRRCRAEVSWWEWEALPDGFWGFDVLCHGERMSGAVREPSPGSVCRLEVFADGDPRMAAGPFWWVAMSGAAIQDSRAYIAAIRPGMILGPFGRFSRAAAPWLGALTPLALALATGGVVGWHWPPWATAAGWRR